MKIYIIKKCKGFYEGYTWNYNAYLDLNKAKQVCNNYNTKLDRIKKAIMEKYLIHTESVITCIDKDMLKIEISNDRLYIINNIFDLFPASIEEINLIN